MFLENKFFPSGFLYSIIFFKAIKSSSVSTPIGEDFARATLIFISFSKALNCSSLFLISFCDCLKETKDLSISTRKQ